MRRPYHRRVLVLAALLLAAASGFRNSASGFRNSASKTITGEWVGTYRSEQSGGTLHMHIDSGTTGWSVRVMVTSEYVAVPSFQNATAVRVRGDSVAFALSWGTPVNWSGRITGDSATGVLATDHWQGSWVARRKR